MSKRKRISAVVLLRQDIEDLIIEPIVRSARAESLRTEMVGEKILRRLRRHERLIEAIAREVKRQADRRS